MCLDSTIPRKRLADILLAIQEMEKKYDLRCCNVFHAGDGNLHPLVLFDANDPDELHRCELFGADILETSVAMGGTVSGEHGVGVEKLNSMCVQFTAAENEQMFGVKRAFDPAGLLNPGKVIPTLQRCAEYGKQVFRAGQAHALCRPAAVLHARLQEASSMDTTALRRRSSNASAPPPPTRTPLCIRGGGTKDFYGEAVARRSARHRARSPASSSYEPSELVVTVARRHAAGRTRGAARRAGPVPAVRAAALRAGRHGRRHGRRRPERARRAPASARCATTCSARTLVNGRGEVLRLRRHRS